MHLLCLLRVSTQLLVGMRTSRPLCFFCHPLASSLFATPLLHPNFRPHHVFLLAPCIGLQLKVMSGHVITQQSTPNSSRICSNYLVLKWPLCLQIPTLELVYVPPSKSHSLTQRQTPSKRLDVNNPAVVKLESLFGVDCLGEWHPPLEAMPSMYPPNAFPISGLGLAVLRSMRYVASQMQLR